MPIILDATTGDTKFDTRMRTVRFSVDHLNRVLTFLIDMPPEARFDLQFWPMFEAQIRSRHLHEWQFLPCPSPLDFPEIHQTLRRIDSTASFQLFVAVTEITSVLNLVYGPDDLEVNLAFITGRFITLGRNGLFFLPENLARQFAPRSWMS